jgi:Skp family chaperone for outer membrane proteins
MSKNFLVCVAIAAITLFTNSVSAQVKIGYINEQEVLYALPGFSKIDTLISSYRLDSLQDEYRGLVYDFQRSDSLFRKDSAAMPAKAREIANRDLLQKRYKLANWQEYEQQLLQAKYELLARPYRQKLFEAIQQVVAEQKYSLIVKQEIISDYFLPSISLLDNVGIRALKKLNIPLGKEVEDAWKAANGAAGGAKPAAVKPAGKG